MRKSFLEEDAEAVDSFLSTLVKLFLQVLRVWHLPTVTSSSASEWGEWHVW